MFLFIVSTCLFVCFNCVHYRFDMDGNSLVKHVFHMAGYAGHVYNASTIYTQCTSKKWRYCQKHILSSKACSSCIWEVAPAYPSLDSSKLLEQFCLLNGLRCIQSKIAMAHGPQGQSSTYIALNVNLVELGAWMYSSDPGYSLCSAPRCDGFITVQINKDADSKGFHWADLLDPEMRAVQTSPKIVLLTFFLGQNKTVCLGVIWIGFIVISSSSFENPGSHLCEAKSQKQALAFVTRSNDICKHIVVPIKILNAAWCLKVRPNRNSYLRLFGMSWVPVIIVSSFLWHVWLFGRPHATL